ncbi:MAG: oligosaccharide flippase family protein [Planctomycetota bacterium]|jgi:O-antigen/teichoic acid export membrane protein
MASGVRDSAYVFVSQVGLLVLGIANQSCLAWFLGPADRGAFAVCLIYATLLTIFFVVGCDVASIYFVSSGKVNISEGIIQTLIYGGTGAALAMVVGWSLTWLPVEYFQKATHAQFNMALLSIPVTLFSLILSRLLTAVNRFGAFGVVTVLGSFLQLVLTFIFIRLFGWGVEGAFGAVISAGVIMITITLSYFHRNLGLTWVSPSWQSLKEMFHYGLRYYVGKISNQVNFQLGTLILAFFATQEQIGIFAVASQVTARAMLVPDALATVLMPRVAGDQTGKRELVAQCARLVWLVCGVLLVVLAVFARPIVTVVFSPKFIDAAVLIQILAVGTLVRCGSKIFVPYLLGIDRPGVASMSVLVGMITNVALLWWLLPRMGLPGAAVAMSIGYGVSSAILTQGFRRSSGLSFMQIHRYNKNDWFLMRNVFFQVLNRLKKN